MPTSDPKALLRRLLEESCEAEWLEFKQDNSDPDMIGRTISACANGAILAERDRAFIVWGIEDKTKKRVGTSVRLRQLKGKGAENLSNWLARLTEPKLQLEFLDFEDGEHRFAILTIDPTYDRPVRFAGAEYIRIGENVRSLKDFPDHTRALWFATGRRKFESAAAILHQSADDVLTKLDTDQYYRLKNDQIPNNKKETIRRFCQCGFIREDMEGAYDITNLGAILFAHDISAFPSIASKSVRVIKYAGNDKMRAEEETEGKKGYAVGFANMLKFIMNRLPKEERYIGGVRKELSLYSETAIREVIANALIHQDFTVSGSAPVVEIYKDRVEVSNPGRSLIEIDRIIDERRSRNEKLAAAMREVGICEERGGGIDKAIIEIEEMSLPALEFFASDHSMRVVIFGPKKFSQLSKSDRVWACFCHCVVRWARRDYMNNASLRRRFSLTDDEYQAAWVVISDARKDNRIKPAEPDQGNRNARYVPYWA